MNCPTSVTIIAILQLISGIFDIFNFLVLLVLGGIGGFIGGAAGGEQAIALATIFSGLFLIFAVISLGLGLMSFFLSIGLLQLKKWAWIGTIIVHVIALMMEAVKLLGSGGAAVNFLTAGFAIAILYYSMRPEVKQAFHI